MKTRRGRTVALLSLTLAVTLLALGGVAVKDRLLESWYVWRLQSDDAAVSRSAYETLLEMGSGKGILFFVLEYDNETPDVDEEAIQYLRQLGAEAVPHLRVALHDERDSVVLEACHLIKNVNDWSFVPDENIRFAALLSPLAPDVLAVAGTESIRRFVAMPPWLSGISAAPRTQALPLSSGLGTT